MSLFYEIGRVAGGFGSAYGAPGVAWATAEEAKAAARTAESEARGLSERIERLSLVNEALWSLLREKLGLTEEQLADRVREVDLSDGQLDGRVRHPAVPCPKCGRTVSRRRDRCLYCGAALGSPPFSTF